MPSISQPILPLDLLYTDLQWLLHCCTSRLLGVGSRCWAVCAMLPATSHCLLFQNDFAWWLTTPPPASTTCALVIPCVFDSGLLCILPATKTHSSSMK